MDAGSHHVSWVSSVPTGTPAAEPAMPSPVISGVMSLAEALQSRRQGTLVQTPSLPGEGEEQLPIPHNPRLFRHF